MDENGGIIQIERLEKMRPRCVRTNSTKPLFWPFDAWCTPNGPRAVVFPIRIFRIQKRNVAVAHGKGDICNDSTVPTCPNDPECLHVSIRTCLGSGKARHRRLAIRRNTVSLDHLTNGHPDDFNIQPDRAIVDIPHV